MKIDKIFEFSTGIFGHCMSSHRDNSGINHIHFPWIDKLCFRRMAELGNDTVPVAVGSSRLLFRNVPLCHESVYPQKAL